jgi:hypothetical protein
MQIIPFIKRYPRMASGHAATRNKIRTSQSRSSPMALVRLSVCARLLGWRCQRFLLEVEAIRHIVGSLISCVQWLQPERNFAELH